MNKRMYFLISGFIFALVAIVHLWRVINQFQVVIGTWSAPIAASWIGLIIAGSLSYWGFVLMGKEDRK